MLNLTYEYGTAAGNDGRIKKINDLVVPDRTVHFEYDGLSRLQRAHTTGGATYPAWELTWSYSAAGNREAQTTVVGNPPSSSLAFDPATNRVNSTGWTHDATGNVTLTPDGSFSIDAAGRMVGHTPASGPALGFAFDATGLRTKRTEGASTTLYLRDGGQVIGERNGTSWSKEYVWLGNTLLATIEGSTIKYHHQDHLSIRATTFADGMIGEEQGHYPFGEPWYETSPETTRIFTTYEREAGGSLDYAMFRWMGPEAGRFLSADPVHGSMGDGQSWNRYAYAGNDPVNRWDPWGLFFTEAAAPFFGWTDIVPSSSAGGGSAGGPDFECWEQGGMIVCVEIYDDVTSTADDTGRGRDPIAEMDSWVSSTDAMLGLGGESDSLGRAGRGGSGGRGHSGSGCRSFFSFLNGARNTVGSLIGIDGTRYASLQASAMLLVSHGQVQRGIGIDAEANVFTFRSWGSGGGAGIGGGLGIAYAASTATHYSQLSGRGLQGGGAGGVFGAFGLEGVWPQDKRGDVSHAGAEANLSAGGGWAVHFDGTRTRVSSRGNLIDWICGHP